jgi:hypothetical protein
MNAPTLTPAAAWGNVITELEAATNAWRAGQRAYIGDVYRANSDDRGMVEAADSDLVDWVADLEDRVGLEVGDLRAAMHDYMEARALAQLARFGVEYENGPDGFVHAGRVYSDIAIEFRDAVLPGMRDGVRHIGALEYEFPDYDGDDLSARVAPLEGHHWHNDVCPSWGMDLDEEHDLRLWADYADPEKRESARGERFALTVRYFDDDAVSAETWEDFITALEAATPQCAAGTGVGDRAIAWGRALLAGGAA